MPIVFRCPCGKKLKTKESMAGKRVQCHVCQAVLTVPGPEPESDELPSLEIVEPPEPDDPPPVRRRFADEDDDEREDRPKPKRRRKKPAARGSNSRFVLLLAGGGVLLLGCLGLIGGAVYYFGFADRGPSAEEQLAGTWETDPEPWKELAGKAGFPVAFVPPITLQFNKDHTFKMDFLIEIDGKWKVVGREGNQIRVKMVGKILGMDQDNPPTVTITVLDKDHLFYDMVQETGQMQVQLRRVGSGAPGKSERAEAKAPVAPREAPPAKKEGWQSYTIDSVVAVDLPADPGRPRKGFQARAGEAIPYTEYSVGGIGPEVRVRIYRRPQPKSRDRQPMAEYIGGTAVTVTGIEAPVRTFTHDGKPAAVFGLAGPRDPGVTLAVGDDSLVVLVSVPGPRRTESDPDVKRIFESVKFVK